MSELRKWQKTGERELKRILRACWEDLSLKRTGPKCAGPWVVGLKICGLQAMKTANRKFRGKEGPTDVLSFPAQPFFYKQGFLGDLLICLPVLKLQAREQGHSARQELRILLTHGILHLLGFDHEKGAREARRMSRAEKRLLGKTAGLIERTHSR